MATITSTPSDVSIKFSSKNSTSASGTISWNSPSIPSGATVTSCVLTGTITPTSTITSATVGGKTISTSGTFSVDLGSSITTSASVSLAKSRGSACTVSFSNLVYTVTYTEPAPAQKNTYIFSANEDCGYVVANGQTYTGKTVSVEVGVNEELSFTIYPNSGYIISSVNIGGINHEWNSENPYSTSVDGNGNYFGEATISIIYAKKIVQYTVTFKDWDGTTLKTQIVDSGSSATAPSNPSRDGYTFTGWDKTFTNVTSDLTVTAQYSIKQYTVTFKDWDGSTIITRTVNHGSSATAPSDPNRDGYNFIGWDKAFNNVISDLTITAQYEIINVPSGPMVDKSATLRPISAVQDSGYNNTWTNIANAYDTDTSTSSTFSITGSGQAGFVKNTVSTVFNFDTSVIPANAVINSATLTVRAKSSATTNLYISVDANGDSSKRIMDETLMGSTSIKDYTGDATDYIKGLNNISLTHRTAGSSTRTFTCYDIRIDVDYSVPSDAELLNTVIINANEDWGYVKDLITNEIYTGTNITVTGLNTEAIDLMIYPNEGYHIAAVYKDLFGEDVGPFTQYPCGLEASVGSNTQTYTYIVTYAKNEEPEGSKIQNLIIGNEIINELFIGEQEIKGIYLGDNLLFKK